MAEYTLLHSGEFTDHDDNIIRVSFYRVYRVRAYPTTLKFDAAGGILRVSVWSTKGNAYLYDNNPSWLSASQISAEQLPGSQYYKYTYEISCSANSGTFRNFTWTVGVEDGPEAGYGTTSFEVTQYGSSQNTLSVSPNYIWFNGSGNTTENITFSNMPVSGVTTDITYYGTESDWLTVQVIRNGGTITASRNISGQDREALVKFTDVTNESNITYARVGQHSTTMQVVPGSIRYNVGGGMNGITVTWTDGNTPTISLSYTWGDPGWITVTEGTADGNRKEWGLQASQNDTLIEREAEVTVTNGIDTAVVSLMQNRQ